MKETNRMTKWKYRFLMLTVVCQLSAFVFTFINIKVTVLLVVGYLVSVILLFIFLIKERLNEKKEEDENDYSDY
jgi:uncharacterized membrane protein